MNEKEQNALRLKVAELRGDLVPPSCKPTIEELEAILNSSEKLVVTIMPNGEVRALKDYPNDLNACAEFEKGLTEEQADDYLFKLEGGPRPAAFATAEQRCRAFVATMEPSS